MRRAASVTRRLSEGGRLLTLRDTKQRRSAFTLLEVVLALGLSSLLMAAIYSALQMHWSYSLVGQVEMERAQVARALFRRIEIDMRSVIFRSTPLSSATDGDTTGTSGSSASSSSSTGSTGSSATDGAGQGSNASTGSSGAGTGSTGSTAAGSSSSSTGSTADSTTTEDAYSTQKSGVFGEADSLIVHVCLPNRLGSGASAATGSSGTTVTSSDLQSVAYFLAGSSSSVAQQFSEALTSAAITRPGQQLGGLARVQADRMAMQAANDSGDMTSMSGNVKLLAPEVSSIQFEFFDGVSWTSTWDSGTSMSLPNAVRVTIDFHPPDTSRTGWFSRPASQSTNRFQQIIAVPLAEPYVEEAS